jgi:hypothetical protein
MLGTKRNGAGQRLILLLILGFAANVMAPSAQSASNVEKQIDISVGGTVGFEDLAKPNNTARLRRTGRVNLYLHDYIWSRTPASQRAEILKVFKDTGPQVLEQGCHHTSDEFWNKYYKKNYVDCGVTALQSHVNGYIGGNKPHSYTLAEFKSFVDGGRKLGIEVFSPVFAPNSKGEWALPFADSKWDTIRAAAAYGGGITIDSPPSYFMAAKPGYQKFVEDEIKWARKAHIKSTFMISPMSSGMHFRDLTKALVNKLKDDHALPDHWIVENYRPAEKVTPDYPNAIGNEANPVSITGVALWLAEHTDPKR